MELTLRHLACIISALVTKHHDGYVVIEQQDLAHAGDMTIEADPATGSVILKILSEATH